jgi:hypothetical protein
MHVSMHIHILAINTHKYPPVHGGKPLQSYQARTQARTHAHAHTHTQTHHIQIPSSRPHQGLSADLVCPQHATAAGPRVRRPQGSRRCRPSLVHGLPVLEAAHRTMTPREEEEEEEER